MVCFSPHLGPRSVRGNDYLWRLLAGRRIQTLLLLKTRLMNIRYILLVWLRQHLGALVQLDLRRHCSLVLSRRVDEASLFAYRLHFVCLFTRLEKLRQLSKESWLILRDGRAKVVIILQECWLNDHMICQAIKRLDHLWKWSAISHGYALSFRNILTLHLFWCLWRRKLCDVLRVLLL